MFPPLRIRHREPELMDQPGLADEDHRRALMGLARINRWSSSDAILWPAIRRLAEERQRSGNSTPLSVLDVATGAGDIPIKLAARARRKNLGITFAGCDRSGYAVERARQNALRARSAVTFFERDVFQEELPTDYDVVTSSLFLHHLEEKAAVDFLAKARRGARAAVLISDLVRCHRGYAMAWLGTRLLSRSPIVHTDGPLSVCGAFIPEEAVQLARQAGWQNPQIGRRWPFRFLLTEAIP